ncbi:hypothetical protein FQN51_000060 [Onygenales sp. PD_10]|nr:hypothetical protein FQN51_000060 [Onygenales sp. PD_10]
MDMPIEPLELAPKRCGFCEKQGQSLRCSRCRVVFYCSREHQVNDRDEHKRSCNKIAKTREKVAAEERRLRESPPDLFLPENVFETSVGHFWGIWETRDYMRARSGFLHALLEVNTLESVKMQLDESRDLLRLCRSDNMGIRSMMPGMMLRLGLDQDCYDFVKWYETTGQDGHYDWGNMDNPFLDVKDADVFESADYLCHRFLDLGLISGVLLLKIRLLLDLRDLQNSTLAIEGRLPRELRDNVRGHLLRSPIIANNRQILERDDHSEAIKSLSSQIPELFRAIGEANEFFWDCMLDPYPYLDAYPTSYSPGSESEVEAMLKYIYSSWEETPGALDCIDEFVYG